MDSLTKERIRDALLVLAIVAALTAAAALLEARHTEASVASDRQAKAAADYAQCIGSGRTGTIRINRLLEALRSDYLERAADAMQLASLPGTSPGARAIRMASAERLRIRASTVFLFPVPSVKDCAEQRDRELAR